jgi:hypothetical protein
MNPAVAGLRFAWVKKLKGFGLLGIRLLGIGHFLLSLLVLSFFIFS